MPDTICRLCIVNSRVSEFVILFACSCLCVCVCVFVCARMCLVFQISFLKITCLSPQLQEFCRQEGCNVPDYVLTHTNVSKNVVKDDICAVVPSPVPVNSKKLRKSKQGIDLLQQDNLDLQPISMDLEQKRARWPLNGGAEPATYSSDAVDARLPRL